MTPKEKAEELFKKYLPYVNDYSSPEQGAKDLCMITVDELMQSDWYIPTREEHNKWVQYWQEVKQEINQL